MKRRVLRQWMMIFGAAALLYGAGSMYQPTVVVGKSMEPTLDPGKVIYVDRTAYFANPPSRGEVVVFKRDGETYVKRVYRGPGESYHYLSSHGQFLGLVGEDDAAAMEKRWRHSRSSVTVRKATVSEDSVFVVGDNAPNSEDSRAFGPIEIGTIIGRAHLEVDLDRARAAEFRPNPVHRVRSPQRMAGA
jgi:signal peptidase I